MPLPRNQRAKQRQQELDREQMKGFICGVLFTTLAVFAYLSAL